MDKFKKNLLYAFIAQGTSTILSILISLILPKMLGIEEFAYWQLFIFYSGYVGFFHFGLSDGLYLRYGGTNLGDMDKSLIGSQFRFMVIWQLIISSFVLVAIPFVMSDQNRIFVWVMTAFYLITANAAWGLGYIFQAANETQIYSTGIIISRAVFIIILLFLVVMKQYEYKQYIILYVSAQSITMIYSMFKGKDFILAKWSSLKITIRETFYNMRIGINLTFSNIASSLILGFGRGFVDSRWDISTFGLFSLAISLVNFILQFITQISMVMFPALRQVTNNSKIEIYIMIRDSLGIILCGVLIFYVPIKVILTWWLPHYTDSLRYLSVILPICVFDGKMQMLYNTYLKVLRKERGLLYINIFSCFLSLALCIIFDFFHHEVIMAVFAMIIAIAARSIIASIYLSKIMRVEQESNLIFEIFLTVSFIFLNYVLSPWIAFITYTTIFIIVIYICREKIARILKSILKM